MKSRIYTKNVRLGSTRTVVDDKGNLLETHDYYPFGAQTCPPAGVMPGRSYTSGTPTKEKFTGKERDSKTGLDYFGARYYLPAYGRWNSYDPLADDPAQVDISPYAYSWNNPTNVTDPDGRCPSCLFGAFVGAATDFGVQVAVNLAEGDDIGTALTDVDGASILVSAGAGAISGGLSVVSKAKNASRLVKLATSEPGEATLDAAASVAGQLADDGKVDALDVVIDVGSGKFIGDKLGDFAESKFLNSKEGKVLRDAVERKRRIAKKSSRPGRNTQLKDARDKLNKEVAKRSVSTSVSASNTSSTIFKEVKKVITEDEKSN